jgi:gliding motility-associated protein GldL
MGLAEITASKGWKNFMAKLYGLGAAVVIVGALFKIQHWPGAGIMLTVGLGTEAIIFFFSAFEPLHAEIDWSIVYPELAMHDEEGGHGHGDKDASKKPAGTPTQQLDNMLEKAKIGPELLESVSDGLKSLGETTSKISDISSASLATDEFVKNVKGASESVANLGRSYSQAAQTASESIAEMNRSYASAASAMGDLATALEGSKNYKEEVAKLTKNLQALNNIYGNMLTAMSTKA